MVTEIRSPKLKSGENRSFIPLNHVISEILGQRNAWFEVMWLYLFIENIPTNSKTFKPWRESLLNGRKTSNVWLPSISCLHPIRTCFSITCPRLGENDGTSFSDFTRTKNNFYKLFICALGSTIIKAVL